MNNQNFANMNMANRGNITQKFITHYRTQQPKVPPGWQQSVTPEERANYALQFYTQFRLAKPEAQELDAMRASVTAESQTFMQSQTKDQYVGTMKQKFMQMAAVRQQRITGMQNNLNNGLNPAQMGQMGQPGVPTPQRTPAQFAQGFPNPQLQRQMQASPIPMPQGQPSMGMSGPGAMNFQQGTNTPQPNMPQPQQPQQQGPTLDAQTLNTLAKRLMTTAKPEFMNQMRQRVEQLPPDRRQLMQAQNIDPLFWCFRQHTEMLARSGRINAATIQALQGVGQPGAPMQQPNQPNQVQNQVNLNQQQQNQNFDLNALANQQIEAFRVQDQGTTVVPASNNANGTQMVGFPGQNNQPGQAQNAAMAQRNAVAALQNVNLQRQAQAQAQQHAQARAQQQLLQQQQQQQQQARNNANQMLQGQIGGLNLPTGTQQSPAMPMLTRPMVPPGQPQTPQQKPQAYVPQMTPQGQPQADPQVVTQLMREAQQRAIATLQQGQPLTEQVRMSLMPNEMEPAMRQQLMKVPDQQFRHILTSYLSNVRNRNNPMQNMSGAQPQAGQPNMMMNNAQAQALQLGMQNQIMNNANLGNIGRAPGMPPVGQPTPNGMTPQQLALNQRPLNQQQKLMIAQQTLQQNPGIIAATDDRPFPPGLLGAQARQSLPPDLRTWAQLKQWASQNPQFFPQMDAHRLLLLQVLHFNDMRQANPQQMAANGVQRPGGLPQQAGTGVGTSQATQATPGQGPVRTPQPQPNLANLPGGPIQVTPQEIQAFRAKLPQPQQQSTPDEQLRNYLMQQKLNIQRRAMLSLQQRNQTQQPQNQVPGQAPQVSRPPTTQPPPPQAPPQPKPTPKQQQAPKPAQPAIQNNLKQGVKRPNDDAAEGASIESSAPNAAPTAPAMVPSRSQQAVPNLTQEQISRLNPQQQAQVRAQLLKAQDASSNKQQSRGPPSSEDVFAKMRDPAQQLKFRNMITEEEKKIPNGPIVQISPEIRAQLQTLIREKMQGLRTVEKCLRLFIAAYEGGDSENLARSIMVMRIRLLRQINPTDMTLQENLTMNEEDFRKAVQHILAFVGKVMSRFNNQQGQANTAQQNQQSQNAEAQPVRQQLTPANLKQHEQQQQRQQKPPQAPTTDRPPFPIGGQSPRGAPTYFEPPKVTNLVLPDKKKQKLDSTAPTPSQKPSPRVGSGKTGSPELKRQSVSDKPVEQKPTFRCKVPDCDPSHRGFDSQAELDAHVKDVHAKIENPLQFSLESMSDYLEVDLRAGVSKADTAATSRIVKPTPKSSQATKTGQTPNIAQNAPTPAGAHAAATPMARVSTQTGVKSSPSTSLLKTPQTGIKAGTPSTGVPAKATPASVTKAASKETEPVIVPEAEAENEIQPFFPTSLFDFSYEDIYAALDTNAPYTFLDLKDEDNSWALRSRPSSPTNTPDSSSKDTPETRQSDISENDNLQINLDIKDVDLPDAWLAALSGDPPIDVQLSEDISALGVTLPPMDNDDMMLFCGDNLMMDLDMIDPKLMESVATLDPSLL